MAIRTAHLTECIGSVGDVFCPESPSAAFSRAGEDAKEQVLAARADHLDRSAADLLSSRREPVHLQRRGREH